MPILGITLLSNPVPVSLVPVAYRCEPDHKDLHGQTHFPVSTSEGAQCEETNSSSSRHRITTLTLPSSSVCRSVSRPLFLELPVVPGASNHQPRVNTSFSNFYFRRKPQPTISRQCGSTELKNVIEIGDKTPKPFQASTRRCENKVL